SDCRIAQFDNSSLQNRSNFGGGMAAIVTATLALNWTVPAPGASAALSLVGNPSFVPGSYLAIDAGGTDPVVGKVMRTPPGTTVIVVSVLGSASIGQVILAGAAVSLSGAPGAQGGQG